MPSPRAEESLFAGVRVHIAIGRLLKAIALFALGVPLHRVEQLLGIKAETVKRGLVSLLRAGKWETLNLVLEQRYRIPRWHRSEFGPAIVVGMERHRSAFRCWSKELRRCDRREFAKTLRLIERILGRTVKAAEIVPRH
jgi:hypothetical protein